MTDPAIEETEEFKSYMDHNLNWQWKHHATQDEAYEACRLILRDLRAGKHVDWDLTATIYLLAARRAPPPQSPTAPTTTMPPTRTTPPTKGPNDTPATTPPPRKDEPKKDRVNDEPKWDKKWELKDPGIKFPVLDPGGDDFYKRVQRIVDGLVARRDEKTAQEIKDLLSGVTMLLGSAVTLIGFYVISIQLTKAGALLVILDKTRIADQIFSRVWHRFETSVKDELEKKLNELNQKLDQNEPKPQDSKPQQPDAPEQPRAPDSDRGRERCQQIHPYAMVCDVPARDREQVVATFLVQRGYRAEDLGECMHFSSFPNGRIDACNGAPGETWHCEVKGTKDVVSVFGCLCCNADGSTSHQWEGAHRSPGGGRSGRKPR